MSRTKEEYAAQVYVAEEQVIIVRAGYAYYKAVEGE